MFFIKDLVISLLTSLIYICSAVIDGKIAFGKSFNNYHPVYNNYFIPYVRHIKENNIKSKYLSPIVADWPRYWRELGEYKKYDLKECISRMNTDTNFSLYYDNAIEFYEFSNKHEQWSNEINRDGIRDIVDYYEKVKEWCNVVYEKNKYIYK